MQFCDIDMGSAIFDVRAHQHRVHAQLPRWGEVAILIVDHDTGRWIRSSGDLQGLLVCCNFWFIDVICADDIDETCKEAGPKPRLPLKRV